MDDALKLSLEEAARDRDVSMARLLDEIVSGWLTEHASEPDGDLVQARLRERALACAGSVRSGDPERAENAGERVRELLEKRHAG